jgi:hypothetical protein
MKKKITIMVALAVGLALLAPAILAGNPPGMIVRDDYPINDTPWIEPTSSNSDEGGYEKRPGHSKHSWLTCNDVAICESIDQFMALGFPAVNILFEIGVSHYVGCNTSASTE